MKITIEHSMEVPGGVPADEISHNVSIEHPCDDMNATQLARLLFYAMTACSYHPNSVAVAFNEIAIENGLDTSPD